MAISWTVQPRLQISALVFQSCSVADRTFSGAIQYCGPSSKDCSIMSAVKNFDIAYLECLTWSLVTGKSDTTSVMKDLKPINLTTSFGVTIILAALTFLSNINNKCFIQVQF